MGDHNPTHFGLNITGKPPIFAQGECASSTWCPYDKVEASVRKFRPCRTLCWQLPSAVFDIDGRRFRHWCEPELNRQRASSMAAVLGMAFTGTSKGWLSGNHEELQRANGEAEDEGSEGDDKTKKIKRVFRYTYMLPENNNVSAPMFVIAYEELYNSALTEVTAIRIWKFVFDKDHSDSELWRKLMDENRETKCASGTAHSQNMGRKKNLVEEQKNNRIMAGGMVAGGLDVYAGTQYTRITSETQLMDTLRSCAGRNMHDEGATGCNWAGLPAGVCATRISKSNEGLGGTHPLGPEYQFNARRPAAFNAWLIGFDDNPLDVHEAFLNPDNYFDAQGVFKIPDVSLKSEGFFFCIDPDETNVFDLPLPRPIYGSVSAGPAVLELFNEMKVLKESDNGVHSSSASVADIFWKFMTKRDSEHDEMERLATEAICSFDAIGLTEEQRRDLRHYGEVDTKSSYIMEPRQHLKELQVQTRRVIADLVKPWLAQRHDLRKTEILKAEFMKRRKRGAEGEESDVEMEHEGDEEEEDINSYSDMIENVHNISEETQYRHNRVIRDVIMLHLNRIESSFQSRSERATIPAGYCAMFDYLRETTTKLGTASVAWAFDNALIGDDTSAFAQMFLSIGAFFEKDCYIEGRDRRIMDEIFLHFFEQYGDVTFVLLLCGYKGNGKSLRTERAMAVFPPNWVTTGGPSSAKSGMNGQSDSTNGKNVVYDEMIDDLCDSEGSDRLEYWKQIVLKREYTYNRTVAVKNPDGTETHRTMKIRTPHNETHCICTNYGMAFTKDGNPGDNKFAMIDRSIAHLVRSIGQNSHPDSEFHANLARPVIQERLTKLRMFISLVGATKLAIMGIPEFQPNLALANKMFDYMDNEVIVGEYNLPRRSPRKCLKRDENLRTLTVMSAVCNVFMYKQTAVDWEAGKLGDDGKPQPFRWAQLYDVIRQLHPSPEQIYIAWSQSLDYNIGTSAQSFAAMTALCESLNVKVGDWMKKPFTERHPCYNSPSPMQFGGGVASHDLARTRLNVGRETNANTMEKQMFSSLTGGDTQDNLYMLNGLSRQRRATAQYRHRCGKDGNSELVMDNPLNVINKIMSSMSNPPDATEVAAAGGSGDDQYMPLYPSCIVASCVHVSSFYDRNALIRWSTGDDVTKSEVGFCATMGTKVGIKFRTKQDKGATVYDTAWITSDLPVARMESYARRIIGGNTTCKVFDLPLNSLRDLLFLLSTKDNKRRITEEPEVSDSMKPSLAFVANENGDPIIGSFSQVRMRGMQDSRESGRLVPFAEAPERHPYSCVSRVPLQRRVDFAINAGRYPAVMPIISNKTTNEAPVRLVEDRGSDKGDKYVELNTSAAFDHTKMMAEAIMRCSMHPGMEGTQERFCDDINGPVGLNYEVEDASAPEGYRSSKLPYSYDLPSISITLDVMSRYYDPNAVDYVASFNERYANLGIEVNLDDLPHMCLRFVGFPEKNRLLLSYKVPTARNPIFDDVEAGDEFLEQDIEPATRSLVSLSLGHTASDEEVEQYHRAVVGSRSMSGVSGPLFSMETWVKHSTTALKERGMVSHDYDIPVRVIFDEPYGLRTRLYEMASIKINKIVDEHEDMKAASRPRDGDDRLPVDKLRIVKKERMDAARHKLYQNIQLPPSLEALRFCGALGIREARVGKLTYANCSKKQQDEKNRNGKRQVININDAVSSSDVKRMNKIGMWPDDTVRNRGREDSRHRG